MGLVAERAARPGGTVSRSGLWAGAIVFAVVLVMSCTADDEPTPTTSEVPVTVDPDALAERDLVRDPSLHAQLGTSVALDLEPSGANESDDTGAAGVDVVPYRVARDESVRFCLDAADAISEFALLDERGGVLVSLSQAGACMTAALPAGDYQARVTHAPSNAVTATPVFIHETSVGTTNEPQCAPDLYVPDPFEGTPTDLWELTTPTRTIQALPNPQTRQPVLSLLNTRESTDPAQGFRITRGPDRNAKIANADGLVVAPSGTLLSFFDPNGTARNAGVTWEMNPAADNAKWTFALTTRQRGAVAATWSEAPAGLLSSLLYPGSLRITLAMRLVARGEDVKALKVGEVALFEGENYTGRAWVLNDAQSFPTALANIKGFVQPRSVKVGCDTTLLAYSTSNRSGTPMRIADATSRNPFSSPIQSASIVSTRAITIETNRCTGCNLRGVDLSHRTMAGLTIVGGSLENASFDGSTLDGATFDGVKLTNASFRGSSVLRATFRGGAAPLDATSAKLDAARLDGATLSNVVFDRARFSGVVVSGGTLTNVTFDNAVLDRADFTASTFRAVAFTNTDLTTTRLAADGVAPAFGLLDGQSLEPSPCTVPLSTALTLSRFAGTRVRFKQLPVGTWRSLDLTDVRFDFSDLPAAQRKLERQELCGLRLRGVKLNQFSLTSSSFAQSDLSYADLTNAQLSFVSFESARIDQASFQYADLTGANLNNVVSDSALGGAVFSGALFAPASLVRARLTKVQMLNATAKIPAAALHDGAIFDGGSFDGTDFTGSDLTGISMVGGSFTRAIFTNTILNGAGLGRGSRPSVFSQAVFCGAKVQGANFNGAALTDALFPTVATTLPDLDNPAATPVPCAAVDLGTASKIEDAVRTVDATCPNSVATTPGNSCTGDQWVPQMETVRPVCPAPRDGGIGPGRVKSCYPCTSNCMCATQRCGGGLCAGCQDAGY
ncbi:MAG: hypothetical protein JWP97_5384 [Labilithrix sp.]|nr:hypothetical protein [Labilithrix sp.]